MSAADKGFCQVEIKMKQKDAQELRRIARKRELSCFLLFDDGGSVTLKLEKGRQACSDFGAKIAEIKEPFSNQAKGREDLVQVALALAKNELRSHRCTLDGECNSYASNQGWWGFSCQECDTETGETSPSLWEETVGRCIYLIL